MALKLVISILTFITQNDDFKDCKFFDIIFFNFQEHTYVINLRTIIALKERNIIAGGEAPGTKLEDH